MLDWLWLIPALPLAGAALLALAGPRLSRKAAAATGILSVGISAAVAMAVAVAFLAHPPAGSVFTRHVWTWMAVANMTLPPAWAFSITCSPTLPCTVCLI